jgi:hypothetical protein
MHHGTGLEAGGVSAEGMECCSFCAICAAPARLAACRPLAGPGLACTSLQGGTAVSASSDLVSATTSWPRCLSSRICGRNKERHIKGRPQSRLCPGQKYPGLCRATGGAGSALRTHLFQQHLEPPGHVGVRDTVGHFQLAVGGQASCRARLRNHPAVGLLHPAVSPVAQAAAGDPVAGASAACRRGERGRARLESLPCRVSGLCTAPEHRDAGSVNTPGWCRVLPKGNTGGEDLGLWAGVAGPAAATGSAGPVAGPTADVGTVIGRGGVTVPFRRSACV